MGGAVFPSSSLKVKVKSLNRIRFFVTPWAVAYQASPSQARGLEWVAISFSRRSSRPRDWTRVSHIVGSCFTVWVTREILRPNYGRGNDPLPKGLMPACCSSQDSCSQCPWLHGRSPSTCASAGDCRTLTGKSGSVFYGVTVPFSWVLMLTSFCLCPSRVSVSPVLWKFCNQILPAFRVKFPGGLQSLCWIPRLGNLLFTLELSQQCENFFGIIVLQFVSHLLSSFIVGLARWH